MTYATWRPISGALKSSLLLSRMALLKATSVLARHGIVCISMTVMIAFIFGIGICFSEARNSDLFPTMTRAYAAHPISLELFFTLFYFWAIYRICRAIPTVLAARTSAVDKVGAAEKRLAAQMHAIREAKILDKSLSAARRTVKRPSNRL